VGMRVQEKSVVSTSLQGAVSVSYDTSEVFLIEAENLLSTESFLPSPAARDKWK
jgi:hypothetical protein